MANYLYFLSFLQSIDYLIKHSMLENKYANLLIGINKYTNLLYMAYFWYVSHSGASPSTGIQFQVTSSESLTNTQLHVIPVSHEGLMTSHTLGKLATKSHFSVCFLTGFFWPVLELIVIGLVSLEEAFEMNISSQ